MVSIYCPSKRDTTVSAKNHHQKFFYNSDIMAVFQLTSKRHTSHCIFDYLLSQNKGRSHTWWQMHQIKPRFKGFLGYIGKYHCMMFLREWFAHLLNVLFLVLMQCEFHEHYPTRAEFCTQLVVFVFCFITFWVVTSMKVLAKWLVRMIDMTSVISRFTGPIHTLYVYKNHIYDMIYVYMI